MIPILYPYNLQSNSATQLKKSLTTKLVKVDGKYIYKPNHLIINLGNSKSPIWRTEKVKWINKPENIAIAVNKLSTFNKLKEDKVRIPDFTQDLKVAQNWIKEGFKVVNRELLCSHSAKGCSIAVKLEELKENAKLWVKYWHKKHEYRVHVVKVKDDLIIFDFVQKKKRADVPNDKINYQIRNHGSWVFARENVKLPKCVKEEAIKAVKSIGLDLCSVDVCYSVSNDQCVILELNSCSGMCETTLKNYANEILNLCNIV